MNTLLAVWAAALLTPAMASGVDATVKPGDDFFAYANGEWLAATAIPVGRQRWGARNEIDAITRQQVSKVLEDAATAPKGTTARKVSDFRAAYLNEAAIEAKGITPVKPLLARIDRLRDKAALTRLLGSMLLADVDPLNAGTYDSSHLLGLSVTEGNNGETTNVAFLLQGGLGLPDRENYVSADPKMQALRVQYQEYIARLMALAGFDRSAQRAQAVMELETAIAQSHATPEISGNDRNADNLWTRTDFANKAPGIDWTAFFAAAGLGKQKTIVAWQPGAVTGAAALVASRPLEAWQDYLRFHALHRNADVLPRAFAEQALLLKDNIAGSPQPRDRAARALDATQRAMSEGLGRIYSERYFPPAYKARVRGIVDNVVAAFSKRVEAVAWMTPESKQVALAKLKTLYFGVGYPENWQDYSSLNVDPTDAAGNVRRIEVRNYRQAVARLGQPVDRTQWSIAPQTVGAILVFQQNAYNFPAALLQAPKFDANASDAMNYGAIGAIVGHEVSHMVDTLGAEYEADGRNRRWWTAADQAGYDAAASSLMKQVAAYRPLPDAVIDGKRTSTENVADLGGLAAAFDAYRSTLGGKAADKEYVKAQDREFFIGFARSWRAKMTEAGLRAYLAGDGHAPETQRIATVRNIDAWYEAFDVQPGDRLYLPPAERVRIW
ncbi:M13 family metallopeptidase [Usitatibacter rugosus]|nr:M13 family metallopeptidase [Usitatibacter rugosus]